VMEEEASKNPAIRAIGGNFVPESQQEAEIG